MRGLKKILFTVGILALTLSTNSCDSSITNCDDENATIKSANEKSYSIGGNILDQEINQNRLITNSIESNTYVTCDQNADSYKVILTLNNKYNLNVTWSDENLGSENHIITNFKFSQKLKNQSEYNVTIKSCAGAGIQSCYEGTHTTGKINGSDVNDIDIICTPVI